MLLRSKMPFDICCEMSSLVFNKMEKTYTVKHLYLAATHCGSFYAWNFWRTYVLGDFNIQGLMCLAQGHNTVTPMFHRRHCVVSLSKTHLSLLSTGSTQVDQSGHN